VGVFAFIARARKFFITYLWNLRFPSIFILLLLIPAAFGVYVFCCRFFRKPELNVTLNPRSTFCEDIPYGLETRALRLHLYGIFANTSEDRELLLVYAYLAGTSCLSFFSSPVSIAPGMALIDKDVLSICTLPKRRPRRPRHNPEPYKTTIYFVDAAGHKFRQRITLMYHVDTRTT
jgi:hypothetical protein